MSVNPPPDYVKAILLEVLPKQCALIGGENLNDVCAFRRFKDSDLAFRLPVGEALEYAANAATVILFVWQIVSALKGAPKPSPTQIEVTVIAECPAAETLLPETRMKIHVAVLKQDS